MSTVTSRAATLGDMNNAAGAARQGNAGPRSGASPTKRPPARCPLRGGGVAEPDPGPVRGGGRCARTRAARRNAASPPQQVASPYWCPRSVHEGRGRAPASGCRQRGGERAPGSRPAAPALLRGASRRETRPCCRPPAPASPQRPAGPARPLPALPTHLGLRSPASGAGAPRRRAEGGRRDPWAGCWPRRSPLLVGQCGVFPPRRAAPRSQRGRRRCGAAPCCSRRRWGRGAKRGGR